MKPLPARLKRPTSRPRKARENQTQASSAWTLRRHEPLRPARLGEVPNPRLGRVCRPAGRERTRSSRVESRAFVPAPARELRPSPLQSRSLVGQNGRVTASMTKRQTQAPRLGHRLTRHGLLTAARHGSACRLQAGREGDSRNVFDSRSQYRKVGISFSSSEPVAARRRLENALCLC